MHLNNTFFSSPLNIGGFIASIVGKLWPILHWWGPTGPWQKHM